jgi:chorismate mutase/prephenate dehydratase
MTLNKEYEQGAVELFTQLMSMSRKLQYKMVAKKDEDDSVTIDKLCINEDTKVAFFGVEGSYAEQAMLKYFGEEVKGISYDTFEKVMKSVKNGEAEYGVLPIENTSTGAIAGIHTLLLNFDNYIVDETDLPIEHALLGIKGTKVEDIRRVYSHQQGLLQCKEFLDKHEYIECFEYPSTSASAKKVKEDNTVETAAISSARAAKVYGLEVLVPKINFNDHNTTRFMIISGKKISFKDANRVSICFEIPHKSGSLYRILSHFIYNNLNLTKIESCPIV